MTTLAPTQAPHVCVRVARRRLIGLLQMETIMNTAIPFWLASIWKNFCAVRERIRDAKDHPERAPVRMVARKRAGVTA